jgi:hypothetical protein
VPVVVQLFGDGRSPCDLCRPRPQASPPPDGDTAVPAEHADCACGYKPELDELPLLGDRRFRFGHLAAGVYWIRAFDPSQRIVEAKRIELGRGGSSWVELDVTPPTSVRVELRHGSQNRSGLFTGEWASVHHEQPAPIVFTFRRDGKDVGEVRVGPQPDDVRSTMGGPIIPLPEDPAKAREAWWGQVVSSQISLDLGRWFMNGLRVDGGPEERLDRERKEGDALAFDCAEPELSNVALAIERLRADLFEVKPLPRAQLAVVVSCGHYASDEIPIDLRYDSFGPLVVSLFPSKDWIEQSKTIAQGPPASCAACHDPNEKPSAPPQQLEISFGGIDGGRVPLKLDLGQAITIGGTPPPSDDGNH